MKETHPRSGQTADEISVSLPMGAGKRAGRGFSQALEELETELNRLRDAQAELEKLGPFSQVFTDDSVEPCDAEQADAPRSLDS